MVNVWLYTHVELSRWPRLPHDLGKCYISKDSLMGTSLFCTSRCEIRIFAFLPPSTRGTVWACLFDPAKAGPSRHMQTCSSFDPTELNRLLTDRNRASQHLFQANLFCTGKSCSQIFVHGLPSIIARKSNTNELIHHSKSWVPSQCRDFGQCRSKLPSWTTGAHFSTGVRAVQHGSSKLQL